MKPRDENELDSLFKDRLTAADRQKDFFEDEWETMEDMLSSRPRKNNKVILLYRLSVGIAAALLLFLRWYFLSPVQPADNKMAGVQKNHPAIRPSNSASQPESQVPNVTAHPAVSRVVTLYGSVNKKDAKRIRAGSLPASGATGNEYRDSITLETAGLAAVSPTNSFSNTLASTTILAAVIKNHLEVQPLVIKNKKAIKSISSAGPRLALAILAAPDVNAVNSFHDNQKGSSYAVQLSLKLTKKLSISTGAAYAIKPYETGLSNYKPANPTWGSTMWASTDKPAAVYANCKVLDIPLNINYQLYNKGRDNLMIGTGLSSYFMLRENYRFSFADQATKDINFEVDNQNRHLLSILNLNATYQRQISNSLGIIVQPYMKLPLTDKIGFGQVDLKSAGIAVGVSYNIRLSGNK